MNLIIDHDPAKFVARIIADKVNAHYELYGKNGKPFIMILPTGSTQIPVYKELVHLYKSGILSFANVVTFNMDEYVGLDKHNVQSYHHYMKEHLFDLVDIMNENTHILDGTADNLSNECNLFEQKIMSYGYINLTLGGVGEDGHIAFNMPYSSLNSTTRVECLSSSTIKANSRFFAYNTDKTPKQALTIGMNIIMQSMDVVILALGAKKSHAVKHAIEGSVSAACPITALQLHRSASIVCDQDACYELQLKTIKYFLANQNKQLVI